MKNSCKDEDSEDDAYINFKTLPKKDLNSEHNVDDNEKVRIKTVTNLVSLLVAEAQDIKGTYLNIN